VGRARERDEINGFQPNLLRMAFTVTLFGVFHSDNCIAAVPWEITLRTLVRSYNISEGSIYPLRGSCMFLLKMGYRLSDYTASDPRRQWFLLVSSALSSTCLQLLMVYCLVYYSTMKREPIYYSETSGCLWTTWRYNPEDRISNHHVHSHFDWVW
jgi:hypothetical protein